MARRTKGTILCVGTFKVIGDIIEDNFPYVVKTFEEGLDFEKILKRTKNLKALVINEETSGIKIAELAKKYPIVLTSRNPKSDVKGIAGHYHKPGSYDYLVRTVGNALASQRVLAH